MEKISIHAAHEGCDPLEFNAEDGTFIFQSTQPMRAATLAKTWTCGYHTVFQSTLPVWAATILGAMHHYFGLYFNPRCPCGQRRFYGKRQPHVKNISIHAAQVAATKDSTAMLLLMLISIHTAHEGCDNAGLFGSACFTISIHAAHEGCDCRKVYPCRSQ